MNIPIVRERLYDSDNFLVAYATHLILSAQPMGGTRHIGSFSIAIEHDERISLARGFVLDAGEIALHELNAALVQANGYGSVPGLEVLYEMASDRLIAPPRWTLSRERIVVVSVYDVIAVVREDEASESNPSRHAVQGAVG